MTGDAGARSAATWLWAAVAGVLVLAFIVWLSQTSEPSLVAEIQEDTPAEATGAAPPPPPTPTDSSR